MTSEPFTLEKAGVKPVIHVLADHGFDSYSTTIECAWKLVEEHPDRVRRFVDASIEGWYSYLYGDPGPANALIKKDNPEMTDDLLVYGRQAMKRHGVVDSGAAKTLGIGAMTDARWKRFAAGMIKAGVYPAGLDLSRAYTLRFVNRGVGMKRPSPAAPLPKGKVPASQLSPPAPLPKGEGRTAETPLFLLPSPLGRGAGGEGC